MCSDLLAPDDAPLGVRLRSNLSQHILWGDLQRQQALSIMKSPDLDERGFRWPKRYQPRASFVMLPVCIDGHSERSKGGCSSTGRRVRSCSRTSTWRSSASPRGHLTEGPHCCRLGGSTCPAGACSERSKWCISRASIRVRRDRRRDAARRPRRSAPRDIANNWTPGKTKRQVGAEIGALGAVKAAEGSTLREASNCGHERGRCSVLRGSRWLRRFADLRVGVELSNVRGQSWRGAGH